MCYNGVRYNGVPGFVYDPVHCNLNVSRTETVKIIIVISFSFLQDFITQCLVDDQTKRLTARELLFHAVLFEVHSLKLLAAHTYTKNAGKSVSVLAFLMPPHGL